MEDARADGHWRTSRTKRISCGTCTRFRHRACRCRGLGLFKDVVVLLGVAILIPLRCDLVLVVNGGGFHFINLFHVLLEVVLPNGHYQSLSDDGKEDSILSLGVLLVIDGMEAALACKSALQLP